MLSKKILLSLAILPCFLFLAPALSVSAQEGAKQNIGTGIKEVDSTASEGKANSDVSNLIKNIVNILSWIVGIVSVIMIIVGGFRYVTSGGDSSRVSSAKNTILYAVIGLIIVLFAQILVNFVIKESTKPNTSSITTQT